MSNSYGITMKGAFVLEKVASLPAWTSEDEGRLVYSIADKELYMGTNTQWEMKESDGYGATDSVFANNDALVAGTIYFIDTTASSLTGILPSSPSIGQVVTIVDNAGTFKGRSFYVNGNGKNIMGLTSLKLDVNNVICKLIYNGTQWITDMGGTVSAIGGGTSSTGGVGNVIHVTADYTANDNDFIFVEAESGAVAITLPSSGLADGTAVSVYDQRGAFTNEPCIVNGNGKNIMGRSTMKIKANYAKVDFIWEKNDDEWKTVYSTGRLGNSVNVVDVSSNYNADIDDFIMADTTAGTFTITLPTSGYLKDKSKISVMDQTGMFGSYVLNVIPSDGTIDGDDILICDIAGLKVDFVWDSENAAWKPDFGGSVLSSSSVLNPSYPSWEVKSADFNATVGSKYLVDTTTAIVIATLPVTANNGQGISFIDGSNTFDSHALSIDGNDRDINGSPSNFIASTQGQKLEVVYYNGVWIAS